MNVVCGLRSTDSVTLLHVCVSEETHTLEQARVRVEHGVEQGYER